MKTRFVVKKGEFLRCAHGRGEVIGFERFDADGNSAPMADIQQGEERILLKLDAGHTWPIDSPVYGMFHHEIPVYNTEGDFQWN